MACPYFYPLEPIQGEAWVRAPRMPLGDTFDGLCRAGGEPAAPGEAELRSACNSGYGRGTCSRFPGTAGADALRFSITADDSSGLRLLCIEERDYGPQAHFSLRYVEGAIEGAPLDDCAARQARVFVESYLKRKARS